MLFSNFLSLLLILFVALSDRETIEWRVYIEAFKGSSEVGQLDNP